MVGYSYFSVLLSGLGVEALNFQSFLLVQFRVLSGPLTIANEVITPDRNFLVICWAAAKLVGGEVPQGVFYCPDLNSSLTIPRKPSENTHADYL